MSLFIAVHGNFCVYEHKKFNNKSIRYKPCLEWEKDCKSTLGVE